MTILLWVQLVINLLAVYAAVKFVDAVRGYVSCYLLFLAGRPEHMDEDLLLSCNEIAAKIRVAIAYLGFTHVFNHRIVDIIKGFLG